MTPSRDAKTKADPAAPLISVIMANYCAGQHIARALDAVLGQSISDLEVLVADDGSTDESIAIAEQAMARDPRVRLLRAQGNGGPARARNRAIDAARGTWIAIVDSDDIIHPERLERLVAAAGRLGADIVADDMLYFYEDHAPASFLLDAESPPVTAISTKDWLLSGIEGRSVLGYLKPLIARAVLADLRYDETLRIGEDYDLVLRLLFSGARMQVIAQPWYLYRRRTGSISHRLSVQDMASMIESQKRVPEAFGPLSPDLRAAHDRRMAALGRGYRYEVLVAAIKQRRYGEAIACLLRHPELCLDLFNSVKDRMARARAAAPALEEAPLRLRLVEGEAVPAIAEAETKTVRVPPYPAPDAAYDSFPDRRIWAELADLARGRRLDVTAVGAAGRYAAGFIATQTSASNPIPPIDTIRQLEDVS